MPSNILEMMLVVLLTMLVWLPPGLTREPDPHVAFIATRALDGILVNASNAASIQTDGVTVIVWPNGRASSTVETYANRPDTAQGTLLGRVDLGARISLVGATTFALAIAHDGSATVISPWTTWAAAGDGGAPCATLLLTFSLGVSARTATLSCTMLSIAADPIP